MSSGRQEADTLGGGAAPKCKEIDSEDEEWDGTIEPTIFKQEKDARERARLIADLQAKHRLPQTVAAEHGGIGAVTG